MKHAFLKALLAAGAIMIAWNCSDESTTGPKDPEYAVTSSAWLLSTDQDYIIYLDGRVTNPEGDIIDDTLWVKFSEKLSKNVERVQWHFIAKASRTISLA